MLQLKILIRNLMMKTFLLFHFIYLEYNFDSSDVREFQVSLFTSERMFSSAHHLAQKKGPMLSLKT